jgi:hypothetical protein
LTLANADINVYRQALSDDQAKPTMTTQGVRMVQQLLASSQERAGRLQRYLLPRLGHLDPLPIATANAQAKQDQTNVIASADRCIAACNGAPDVSACMRTCGGDALIHVQRCNQVDWLPY